MDQQLQVINGHILTTKTDFKKMAEIHGAVDFEVEASYALQVLKANNFLAKIAMTNPDSLKYAVLNVASIGLTLNPTTKYAYLVPRKGTVCLDISYMGMVQLAVESGAMKWIQAKLVRLNDEFKFNGIGDKPTHKHDPFGDRGPVVGVYCMAKTEDGEYLTETMSVQECHDIRDRSEAWKRNQSGPWLTDEGEMMKKTVIKRAFKLWPKNDKTERLGLAIDTANRSEGIDFEAEAREVVPQLSPEQHKVIIEYMTDLGREESPEFFDYVTRICKRDIKCLEDLNVKEANMLMTQLQQFLEADRKKKLEQPVNDMAEIFDAVTKEMGEE